MTKPTLTEIKKSIIAAGGSYKKETFNLNGQAAYTVNGSTMTKKDMIESFLVGGL